MTDERCFRFTVARIMRTAFFDISPDGVLVYLDPVVGALANPTRQLLATVNPAERRIELRLRGRLREVFELSGDVVSACHGAFKAYFETFAALCQEQRYDATAA